MTSPSHLREPLDAAIAALQSQRAMLGDALVDAALAPLLEPLAALSAALAQTGPATPAEPNRRLRQVSVLFLDIVGSTQLIQTLTPEDVQAVVDGALSAFAAIVKEHGGEVLRYVGDSLKVAFGAHDTAGTREDDAERAVKCGLALLAEAVRRGDEVRRLHGHDGFNARVGIHTGGVVRGGGVENDNSLSGLAVNIAARLEQAAPAGTLRISVDTYRQVQGRFDVQVQPVLQVKGLQEPLQTFLVLGERERRLRGLRHGVEGTASVLVGRDAELMQLRALTARVLTQGGFGAATVVSEAGLGKSRLLADVSAEVLAELMTEAPAVLPADLLVPERASALWSASGHPQGLNQPCGLLRDLLFWHHGVKDSDTQAQAQQKFAAALAPIFGAAADEQTALLGQLIGLDYSASPFIAGILRDGKQLRARGFHAFAEYLRLQAAQQPLVLVLDDLQWADDESLNAIDHLVAMGAAPPIVLLCGARPELLQRRPDWGAAWPAHQTLTLTPLATEAGDALAQALLQRMAEPSPQLQALLSKQAAGNPYYMEALLQMLVDRGVIQTDGERWQVQEDRLQNLEVPPTLVGVLQATLDALTAGERQSLQQASVVGAQFWAEA
jgi:class 3 adenylate cyclase